MTAVEAITKKYPRENRVVWYYYNINNRTAFLRRQFDAPRAKLAATDIDRLRHSFLSAWAATDFNKSKGVQILGPDTTSITISGSPSAAFDQGPNVVSAEYFTKTPGIPSRASKPDFTAIESAFKHAAANRRTKDTKVQYTGFKPGINFVFQRGQGRGWTRGVRTSIPNATLQDFESLRRVICSFIGQAVPVTVYDRTWQVMVKSETTPDFYAIGYDPTTRVLNLLHATIEDEICIPHDWQTIDYLTN